MSNPSIDAESLTSIYLKIQELEKKIKEIDNNKALIVNHSNNKRRVNPLKMTYEEVINIYNYTPSLLENYAIPVSVKKKFDSNYIDIDIYKNVYLERDINGYYWVLMIEEDHKKKYVLTPHGKKRLNLHRLESQVKSLFTLNGDKPSLNSALALENLVTLNILPSGNDWELREKGSIHIGKSSSATKLLNELEKVTDENQEVPESLKELLRLVEKANSISALKIEADQKLENQVSNLVLSMKEIEKVSYMERKILYHKIQEQKEQIKYICIGGGVITFLLLLMGGA